MTYLTCILISAALGTACYILGFLDARDIFRCGYNCEGKRRNRQRDAGGRFKGKGRAF